jgi:plastocyanin
MKSRHMALAQRATALLSIPLFALAIVGCGGGDDNSSSTASTPATTATTPATTTTETPSKATTLKLEADPGGDLSFNKKTLAAPAGKVTIDMKNPAPVQHNVAIKGDGADETGEVVSSGGTSTVTADLQAGTYTFYCSVDGHEAAGMKGTLTVK